MREINLCGKVVADDLPAFVIAEIGHNHGGDLYTCLRMIDEAKKAGADCVKLQKRDNKTLYAPQYYHSSYSSPHAYGATYGEHREALEFGKEEYEEVRRYCSAEQIGFAATAFDIPSAHFLADIGVDFIKVASGDVTSLPLLTEIATLGLPVVYSTGGAKSMHEVVQAKRILSEHDVPVAVLQCTSGYPASWDELNLRVIEDYRYTMPDTVVGWSMHARGTSQAAVAYALGARIIEAHFTLDRYAKGTDQAMSLESEGLAAMVRYLGYTRLALGTGVKVRYPSEAEALKKQWKNPQGQIDGRSS